MFHFRRRTLWIIIYITIPLIIILNNLTSEEEGSAEAAAVSYKQSWSLDELEVVQRSNLYWLPLDSAASIQLSLVMDAIPTTTLAIKSSDAFSSHFQGGQFVITVANPVNEAALTESLTFLEQWLPPNIDSIVVSGPYSEQWADLIEQRLTLPVGSGMDIQFAPASGLTLLTSPPMNSPDQLAFLMAASILKQRLTGYEVQMAWDHRREQSVVSFNSTMTDDVFYPITQAEFEPIKDAFNDSASVRDRSQSQIHRYLLTAVLYDLPFSFFVEQPERLAAIELEDVNRMMEFSLEQIKTRQP